MLARNYEEVVIEDLDIAAMKRSMGRRAFRRSVPDAALGRSYGGSGPRYLR
jgi:putative transposase